MLDNIYVGVLTCAAIILATEVGFLLLGLLLLPWTRPRAKLGAAARHALRSAWLHTGHLVIVLCAYVATHIFCEETLGPFHRPRWRGYESPRTSSVWLQWLADYYVYLLPALFAAGVVWFLWAVLRAASAPVLAAEPPPPPLCEACGYNLSYHQELSAACPECGRPVAWSLAGNLRAPAACGRLSKNSRPAGFWRASARAWDTSEEFFMGLSAFSGGTAAGTFLLRHLLLAAITFAVGFAIPLWVLVFDRDSEPLGWILFVLLCMGTVFAFGLGCLASLLAAIAGLILSRQEKRNLLGPCLRAPCYCAGLFPLWSGATSAFFITAMEAADRMGWPSAVPRDVYVVIAYFALHAIFLVVYVGGAIRRLPYTRYANT
jgi:hypothetical protein